MKTESRRQKSDGAQRGSHSLGELGRLNEDLLARKTHTRFRSEGFPEGGGYLDTPGIEAEENHLTEEKDPFK